MKESSAVSGPRRRLAVLCVASLVTLSGTLGGCGVRSGMERVDDAKQAKKQAENVQHRLQKDLKKGQDQ